jgi:hypothetical protein
VVRIVLGIAVLLAAGLVVTGYELLQTKSREADLEIQRAQLVTMIHANGTGFDTAASTLDVTCRSNAWRRTMLDRYVLGVTSAKTADTKLEEEQCQSLVQDFRSMSAKVKDVK